MNTPQNLYPSRARAYANGEAPPPLRAVDGSGYGAMLGGAAGRMMAPSGAHGALQGAAGSSPAPSPIAAAPTNGAHGALQGAVTPNAGGAQGALQGSAGPTAPVTPNQSLYAAPAPGGPHAPLTDQGGFDSPAIRALLQRIQQMNALKLQQAQGMQGMPTLGGSHPSPFAAYLQNGPFS